jgi:hypothetical protein
MIKKRVMAFSIGLMDEFMMVNGEEVNNMARENILIPKESLRLASGMKVKE